MTQAMAGERGQFHVRASKGIHLVVPRDRIQSATGLILRTETSVLFVIPWGRHWIIGTTDTDWDLGKAHPAASRTDIDYLLEHVNRVLVTPLTRDDVRGRVRRVAPAAVRRVRAHVEAVPRAHGRPAGAGARGRGGRQVHDVPRDGQGRRRRREPGSRPQRPAQLHRPGAARRRGGVRRAVERAAPAGPAARPGRRGDRAPARAARLTRARRARPDRRRPVVGPSISRAPPTTSAPRWSTRPATRAPATSTTCSPGVPACRSRRSTGGLPPRRPSRR